MELQRIPEWYVSRLGKFTGSEFGKLMTSGRGKDQLFGQTALSYIDDKIAEIITNGTCIDYKAFQTRATEWGNYYESEGKRVFTERSGIEVIPVGFIDIDKRFGCSPDGYSEFASIEVKCPFNTSVHVKHLELETGKDLLEFNKDYYTQVQIEMMALKKNLAYFISYDPRCSNESFQLKVLPVQKDEEYQKEIIFRYKEALKILEAKIDRLFNLSTELKTVA